MGGGQPGLRVLPLSVHVIPPGDPAHTYYFIVYFLLELSLGVYASILSKCILNPIGFPGPMLSCNSWVT